MPSNSACDGLYTCLFAYMIYIVLIYEHNTYLIFEFSPAPGDEICSI